MICWAGLREKKYAFKNRGSTLVPCVLKGVGFFARPSGVV